MITPQGQMLEELWRRERILPLRRFNDNSLREDGEEV